MDTRVVHPVYGLMSVQLPADASAAGRILQEMGLLHDTVENSWLCKDKTAVLLDASTNHRTFVWHTQTGEPTSFFDSEGNCHVLTSECRRRELNSSENGTNSSTFKNRLNRRVETTSLGQPVRLAHVALWTEDPFAEAELFKKSGFVVSDVIKDRCVFLRCSEEGDHHNLLLVKSSEGQTGIHHLSFEMADVYSVFSKGLSLDALGWKTQLGPGRHPISSATFWYFDTPIGVLEVTSDSDFVSEGWTAKEWEACLENTTEWAIDGGINGHTRRQNRASNTPRIYVEQHGKN